MARKKKWRCPECGGFIIYRRVENLIAEFYMEDTGELVETERDEYNDLEIYCEQDSTHTLEDYQYDEHEQLFNVL